MPWHLYGKILPNCELVFSCLNAFVYWFYLPLLPFWIRWSVTGKSSVAFRLLVVQTANTKALPARMRLTTGKMAKMRTNFLELRSEMRLWLASCLSWVAISASSQPGYFFKQVVSKQTDQEVEQSNWNMHTLSPDAIRHRLHLKMQKHTSFRALCKESIIKTVHKAAKKMNNQCP